VAEAVAVARNIGPHDNVGAIARSLADAFKIMADIPSFRQKPEQKADFFLIADLLARYYRSVNSPKEAAHFLTRAEQLVGRAERLEKATAEAKPSLPSPTRATLRPKSPKAP
jgi:hypothetical protein